MPLPGSQPTQAATVAALRDAGYGTHLYADGGGISSGDGRLRGAAPEEFVVVGEYRFEGMSDPDDEALVLAVEHEASGLRGTLDVAYGPDTSPEESEALRRLPVDPGCERH